MSVGEYKGNAGTENSSFYKKQMSRKRFLIREWLKPIIKYETPILHKVQKYSRCKFLDWFLPLMANLGSHTFYVICMPIPFWFNFPIFARGCLIILGLGVYFTGVVKDYLCLPRPLSPPLYRLSMSKSSALEYGCPSTHSANAIGVTLWIISCIPDTTITTINNNNNNNNNNNIFNFNFNLINSIIKHEHFFVYIASIIYLVSMISGRIYCGMHGFIDIFIGLIIGTILWGFIYIFLPTIDFLISLNSIMVPIISCLFVFSLIYIHPKPIENCPCFKDSISFLGILLGYILSEWYLTNNQSTWELIPKYPYSTGYDYNYYNYFNNNYNNNNNHNLYLKGVAPYQPKSGFYLFINIISRILIGMFSVAIWRFLAKSLLFKIIPKFFKNFYKFNNNNPSHTKVKNILEIIANLFVYSGIAYVVLIFSPIAFNLLGFA